ncbi:ATP-binding cassette domain-containing protein [Emticicia sp. C21]|uniref:ATP-binding cassette domain-containing protein n=1 Tax=Emticicia sp. C21 TaxID=2302915 RepID=UPI0018F61E30|nr:ATP-binding cassette domain-containing protein [Emticicia sp. C21]
MAQYSYKDTILKVDNVNLTLGDKVILENVNAEVRDATRPGSVKGQIVGFLGPSGIGKTKLFEIMAGLLKPTSGNVYYGPDKEPAHPGCTGVVQQNYPLFMHRTVLGNLEIAAVKNYKNADERKTRIFSLLDRFKLRPYQDSYPAQLSGGQKQRVAIAQQLLCTDNFLLMDEPFSGLDINMVEEVSEMIVEIANMNEHNTIIIVSHDIVSTAAIADNLWLMGREKDKDGNPTSGSKIKYTFDLLERGLAWREDIRKIPEFTEMINEIRDLFHNL